jgi:lysophospholipase L1-like esterase
MYREGVADLMLHPDDVDEDYIKRTKALLNAGKDIKICFYGDSITAGCDGSGAFGIEPFMPGWPQLLKDKLEKTYGSKIETINTAVGGKRSDWGLECAEERLANYKSDLAVIAFGMNDGTEKISAEDFRQNIMGIMDKALMQNKDMEFILIATTLPNSESVFDGYQRQYYNELMSIKREKDAVINMTEVHSMLLERKRFIDMTGNNINHPNDFLIRIYAQVLTALF